MSNREPRVSIGLPVFNGERYLADAIESILAQTVTDFELIISDNASTDDTEDICRQFAARDDRIRYVRHDVNCGMAGNFMRALALARGEFFKWQASDDTCGSQLLEVCLPPLEEDPDAILCFPRCAFIDGEGKIIGEVTAANRPRNFSADRPADRFLAVLMHMVWCIELYGVFRTDMLRQTRYRSQPGSEKVILAELALLGKFHQAQSTQFFFRRHEEQYSEMDNTLQATWMSGRKTSRVVVPRLVHNTFDYGRLITRAPISAGQKLACFGALGRFLLQVQKWRRVCQEMFGGAGTLGRIDTTARSQESV